LGGFSGTHRTPKNGVPPGMEEKGHHGGRKKKKKKKTLKHLAAGLLGDISGRPHPTRVESYVSLQENADKGKLADENRGTVCPFLYCPEERRGSARSWSDDHNRGG